MRQILATLLLLHYLVILTIISGLIYIENISFPLAKHLKTQVYPPSQRRRQKWSTFFSPGTLTTMLQTPTTVMVWIGGFFLCHWAQSSNTKSSSLNKRW